MAQFSVNAQRFDPYKNFKFRVKWDGRYVAGVSKVSALKRTTEVVEHREGGDPISVELTIEPKDLVQKGLERGVIINLTAKKVIRLAPPINITSEQWSQGIDAVIEVIAGLEGAA